MPKYRCYFLTTDDKAQACFFVDSASAKDAAAEAIERFNGTGYAALEVWNGVTCELVMRAEPERPAQSAAAEPVQVLLVDDDPLVRSITAELLRDEGFTVKEASSGQEVLDQASGGLKFDVLLTDIRMPGMTGYELANRLAITHPLISVVYMTGFPVTEKAPYELRRREAEMLQKPVPVVQLTSAVRRALNVQHAG